MRKILHTKMPDTLYFLNLQKETINDLMQPLRLEKDNYSPSERVIVKNLLANIVFSTWMLDELSADFNSPEKMESHRLIRCTIIKHDITYK